MKKGYRVTLIVAVLAGIAGIFMGSNPAVAASAEEIDREVKSALEILYAKSSSAKELGEWAKGILVFPRIYKAGLIVGGQYGEGALLINGKTAGYYNTVQASVGLQVGAQKFGYALFFTSDSAWQYLDESYGWEVGVGPTIVVGDVGASRSATTTTLKADVYPFFFSQEGLMGGLGLQVTKITMIEK